jgi:hypothetical protein
MNDVNLAMSIPDLYATIPPKIRRTRTVAESLFVNAWIRDIKGALTAPVLVQYLELRNKLHGVALLILLRNNVTSQNVQLQR